LTHTIPPTIAWLSLNLVKRLRAITGFTFGACLTPQKSSDVSCNARGYYRPRLPSNAIIELFCIANYSNTHTTASIIDAENGIFTRLLLAINESQQEAGMSVTNRAEQSIKQGIFIGLGSVHLNRAIHNTYQGYRNNRLGQCICVAHNARRYPKGVA
jgi:hypothetical protein